MMIHAATMVAKTKSKKQSHPLQALKDFKVQSLNAMSVCLSAHHNPFFLVLPSSSLKATTTTTTTAEILNCH